MTLLACLDASVYADSVTAHTAWLAQKLQQPVRLLHVLDPHREHADKVELSGIIGVDARDTLLEEIAAFEEQKNRLELQKGRALVEKARQALADKRITQTEVLLRHGRVVDTVAAYEVHTSMIIMGKRGEHADFAKLHLGSNLERVVRAVQKPVFVAARAYREIKTMALAYDASPSAKAAVAYLLEHSFFTDYPLYLITVGKEAEPRQAESLAALHAKGYTVHSITALDDVEGTITAAIATHTIDVLLMGSYGHSRLRNFLIGSTTSHLVQACKIPVLLFS